VAYRRVCTDEETSDGRTLQKTWVCSCSVHQLFTDLQTIRGSVTIDVLHNIQTEFGLTLIYLG